MILQQLQPKIKLHKRLKYKEFYTISDNGASLWRYFEFLSSKFQHSGERSSFRNAKTEENNTDKV